MAMRAGKIFTSKLADEWRCHPNCELHKTISCYECPRDFVNTVSLRQWMESQEGGESKTNIERILEEMKEEIDRFKPNFASPNSIFEGERRCVLVFSILLSIDRAEYVYIFQSAGIIDDTLELLRENHRNVLTMALRKYRIPNPDKIFNSFEHHKWSFTSPCFGLKTTPGNGTLVSGTTAGKVMETFVQGTRLPFCRRNKVNEGGTAKVFQVLVPEAFVSEDLRTSIGKGFKMDDYGKCYELAVKSYSEYQYEIFQSEVNAFQGLSDQPGMVRYFGWYQHHDGQAKPTYNILLEFGKKNLSEYFFDVLPPVQTIKISAFWKSILKVAEAIQTFHEFPHLGDSYYGWHGDVKPANILQVGEEFKLADFGFSKFKEGTEEKDIQPETFMREGTYTYGAPEFARAQSSNGKIRVSQRIDTWSFGCVLSVTVTWVVLGSKGVEEYETLRQIACKRRTPDTKTPPGDAFHNGSNVLPEIKHWHNYLRQVMRKSDSFTAKILDLIDNYLLQDEPNRMTSKELYEGLRGIISDPMANTPLSGKNDNLETDETVMEALLEAEKFHTATKSNESTLDRSIIRLDENKPQYYALVHPSLPNCRPREEALKVPLVRSSLRSNQSRKQESILSSTPFPEDRPKPTPADSKIDLPIVVDQYPTTRNTPAHVEIIEATDPLDNVSTRLSAQTTVSTPQSQDTHSLQVPLPNGMNIWEVVKEKADTASYDCSHILSKDPEVVKRIDENGCTPIMRAAKANNIPIVRLLLPTSPLQLRDMEGKTLLHHAVMGLGLKKETTRFLDTIREIIDKSNSQEPALLPERTPCLVNIPDYSEKTPLYYCIDQNMLKTARFLVRNKAWINPPPGMRGADVLIEAIEAKKEQMVEIFLERGDFEWNLLGNHLEISDIPKRILSLLESKHPLPKPSRWRPWTHG